MCWQLRSSPDLETLSLQSHWSNCPLSSACLIQYIGVSGEALSLLPLFSQRILLRLSLVLSGIIEGR